MDNERGEPGTSDLDRQGACWWATLHSLALEWAGCARTLANDKVEQMDIISKPDGFAFNQDDDPVKMEELIYKLQGEGILKQQLTSYEYDESEDENN